MSNERIHYPVHQVGIKPQGASDYVAIHGLQQFSNNISFNLEQVFELGQLSIYENIEDIADVELTMIKVLDGYPPIVTLASSGASTPELVNRTARQCLIGYSLFDDTVSSTQGETVRTSAETSGAFMSSIAYSMPIEGNFTESVTFSANDRVWKGDSKIVNPAVTGRAAAIDFPGAFDGTDTPQGNSGVNRREDVLFSYDSIWGLDSNGQVGDVDATILPKEIFGITDSGTNEFDGTKYGAHITNMNVSVDLALENLFEHGQRNPFFKSVTFPVQVTTEIEVTTTSGDYISATEDGILTTSSACTGDLGNLSNNTIRIALCEGLRLYMGTKNKLSSINTGGGDAGGGNVTVSYTYTTFSDFTIMHSNDPAI